MVKGQNAATLAQFPRRPPPLAAVACNTRYKGVRLRSWGSWVSEIRIPHSREKIWLGSYATAEQAAHAFDAATLLLRGPSCPAFLNFADSTLLTRINQRAAAQTDGPVSPHTIQATAAAVAKAAADSQPSAADRVLANEAAVDASETSTGHCSQLYVSEQAAPPCETDGRGHNLSTFDSMLQDVISLLSPKEKSTNQLHNSIDHEMRLFDDFHPFATLARDGFIAISAVATTLERFNADPRPCEMIDVRLWNYV